MGEAWTEADLCAGIASAEEMPDAKRSRVEHLDRRFLNDVKKGKKLLIEPRNTSRKASRSFTE